MFNVHVDYPDADVEEKILEQTTRGARPPLQEVIDGQTVLAMQRLVEEIVAAKYVVQYAGRLVRATRPASQEALDFIREWVEWGAGPRAGQYLILGAKAMAAMDGRLNVSTQDIRDVAVPVLRHRLACNFQAQAEAVDSVQIVQKLLQEVEEPDVRKYE